MSNPKVEKWHVGREIPIVVVVTMFIQTMGIVWWASSINNKVDAIRTLVPQITQNASEIAVLKSQNGDIKSDLIRIEVKVDRLLERTVR
jgi:hypothetical protein